jgi:hypothetical protein
MFQKLLITFKILSKPIHPRIASQITLHEYSNTKKFVDHANGKQFFPAIEFLHVRGKMARRNRTPFITRAKNDFQWNSRRRKLVFIEAQ